LKPSIKIALGVLTALSVMAFIVGWEFFFKERIDSAEVVVVKAGQTIQEKEQILPEYLTVERRAKKDLIDGVVYAEDMKGIIGEDAAQVIVGNSMLSTAMIDFDDLVPDPSKDEAIRPVINDWIYAIPGSIRRKDRIDIYALDKQVIQDLSEDNQQINSDGDVVVIRDEEEAEDDTLTYLQPLLSNVPVIYAKDGSNKEVVTQDGQTNRLNGSADINELELLLNEDDFKTLADAVMKDGKRLYITYN